MDKIPPPPKFNEPGIASIASTHPDRHQLIEAAARTAQDAATGAPAQRDRLAQQQSHQPPPPYTPPEWSGLPPPSFQYSLEILKQGTIITHLPSLSSKPFWTFGRTPDNDIILDHPSSSRLHAILQFRSPPDPAAYLYDPGSTHGVFVNKAKHPIPHRQYHLLRVGDVFTLGQSSRMYVFGGAQGLMPPEDKEEGGPSKLGRKNQQQQQQNDEAAMLEAMAKRRERDAAMAKSQMQAALASKAGGGGGGAFWGMLDDDNDDNGDDTTNCIDALGEVDWRAYALSNTLSDKQQKLADKIRKKESRIDHLSREIENIQAKQGVEELSSGQATTVMRNEGNIEVARKEIEELEDLLCDSIRSATGGIGGGGGKGKKRKQVDDDMDGDTVWDRTAIHNNKKNKKKRNGGGVDDDEEEEEEDDDDGALDVATLMARKETLVEEKERIEMDLVKEEEAKKKKKKKKEGGGGDEDDGDALDAFMSGLKTTMEGETVDSLKKQLDGIHKEIGEVERLIKIADPDGWYNIEEEEGGGGGGGRKRRADDVLRAKKKLQEQQDKAKRKKVEEEEKRKAAVEREEEEEEEEEGKRREQVMAMMMDNNKSSSSRKQPVGNIHRIEGDDGLVGGLQTMKKKIDEAGEAVKQKMEGRRAEIAAKLSAMKGEKRGGGDDVTASVLADLALLRGATAGYGAMAERDGDERQ